MVKIGYSSLLFFLIISYCVLASETSSFREQEDNITERTATNAVESVDFPGSANLQETRQSIFPAPSLAIRRDPSQLITFNQPRVHPLSEQDRVRSEVIPPGLKHYWSAVQLELGYFQSSKSQADVIFDLLKLIINDDLKGYRDLEPRFIQVFGTSFIDFSMYGRSVLGWLISFGAADILSSNKISQFKTNDMIVEQSCRYLAENHNAKHVSRMISFFPFLLKVKAPTLKGILFYVYNNAVSKQLAPEETLAYTFSELKEINIVHIHALFPLLNTSNEIAELIKLSFNIANQIKASQHIQTSPDQRICTYNRFKYALMTFFSHCVKDYNSIGLGERFSIAKLFIEFDNDADLIKLLSSSHHTDILTRVANSRTLLTMCIEMRAFKCANYILSLNPTSVVTSTRDGYQAPLVQAIMTGSSELFNICLELLTSNEPFEIKDTSTPTQLSPISLAIMYDQVDFLHQLLNHFRSISVPVDIRAEFDQIFSYLEEFYIKSNCSTARTEALIPDRIWLYLLKETQISVGIVGDRSLLDLAVIDRNPGAVQFIVEKREFDVNTVVNVGSLRGNCLRFLKADIPNLQVLLALGIDINSPFSVERSAESLEEDSIFEELPTLVHLMTISNPEFQKFLETVQISREAAESVITYASKRSMNSIVLNLAESIIQKYKNGTYQ